MEMDFNPGYYIYYSIYGRDVFLLAIFKRCGNLDQQASRFGRMVAKTT
jgi:hypothetical protein